MTIKHYSNGNSTLVLFLDSQGLPHPSFSEGKGLQHREGSWDALPLTRLAQASQRRSSSVDLRTSDGHSEVLSRRMALLWQRSEICPYPAVRYHPLWGDVSCSLISFQRLWGKSYLFLVIRNFIPVLHSVLYKYMINNSNSLIIIIIIISIIVRGIICTLGLKNNNNKIKQHL